MMTVTCHHFTMQPAPCGKIEQELLPAKSGGGRACFLRSSPARRLKFQPAGPSLTRRKSPPYLTDCALSNRVIGRYPNLLYRAS
jgi:hypothetical protein